MVVLIGRGRRRGEKVHADGIIPVISSVGVDERIGGGGIRKCFI